MRVLRVAAAVLALAFAPSLARASDRLDLSWSAPTECPSPAAVAARIEAELGADVGRRTRVTARVDREGDRYKLALAIAGRGERVIVADTCDALAASAAVVVGMSDREETTASEPPPAVVASAPPPPTREAPRAAPAGDRVRLLARLEGLVDVGMLPVATPGGGVTLGVRSGTVHGEISAAAFASQRTSADVDPSRGASFSLASAALRGCWTATRRIEVAPCLGVHVVRIGGTGSGARQVSEGASIVAGPEASLEVRLPFSEAFGLRAGAAASFPIGRQAFVITSLGAVHTPAPVALHAFVGPEVSF